MLTLYNILHIQRVTMEVYILRRISKFADSIIKCGYNGNTNIRTLFADMGYTTLPDNIVNILTKVYECEQNLSFCPPGIESFHIQRMESVINIMMATIDIEKIIMISDELYITRLTNLIVNLNRPLYRTMDNHIINHNCCRNNSAVAPYNTGYKVLWDAKYECSVYYCPHINILENSIRNGLYIKKIRCDTDFAHLINMLPITGIEEIDINYWRTPSFATENDVIKTNLSTIKSMILHCNINSYFKYDLYHTICDIVALLPSLEFIEINGGSSRMSYHKSTSLCVSHAIKSLSLTRYQLNGMLLDLFGKIRKLRMSHCNVDVDDIIPNTVTWLHITDTHINDALISTCTKIRYLNITNSNGISTCAPFAKTLQHLLLRDVSTMENTGLALCTNLKVLNTDNPRITTCAPFAKTLTKLYATNDCGICDDGLKLCSKLKYLDASSNPKITTCNPFANSLEVLYAKYSCGIGDDGLKICLKLKYLNAASNPKITTCSPFARTLLHLYACNNLNHSTDVECGITDDGIKTCTKLIELNSYCNDRITLKLPIIYNE